MKALMPYRTATYVALVATVLIFYSNLSQAGTSADNLREGMEVALHNLETNAPQGRQFLNVNKVTGKISLTGDRTEVSAKWVVHETATPGVFTIENLGAGSGRFLDGLTLSCGVGLARILPQFTGTAWQVSDQPNPDLGGFDHVTLQSKGNAGSLENRQCPFPNSYLNVDADGNVGLTPSSGGVGAAPLHLKFVFPGTHWELILWDSPLDAGGEDPCRNPAPGVHCDK